MACSAGIVSQQSCELQETLTIWLRIKPELNRIPITRINTLPARSTIRQRALRLLEHRLDRRAGAFHHAETAVVALGVIDTDASGGNLLQQPGQRTDRTDRIAEGTVEEETGQEQQPHHHKEGCGDIPMQQLKEIDRFVDAVRRIRDPDRLADIRTGLRSQKGNLIFDRKEREKEQPQ